MNNSNMLFLGFDTDIPQWYNQSNGTFIDYVLHNFTFHDIREVQDHLDQLVKNNYILPTYTMNTAGSKVLISLKYRDINVLGACIITDAFLKIY